MKKQQVTTKEKESVTLQTVVNSIEVLSKRMDIRFDAVDKRFDNMDKKIEEGDMRLEKSIDSLALMTAEEFKMVHARIDNTHKMINTLDLNMGTLDKKIDDAEYRIVNQLITFKGRIDDLSAHRATQDEVSALAFRMRRVEKKVGLVK